MKTEDNRGWKEKEMGRIKLEERIKKKASQVSKKGREKNNYNTNEGKLKKKQKKNIYIYIMIE